MRLAIVLGLLVVLSSMVVALPLSIDNVELNDVVLAKNAVTRLDVARGDEFALRVKVTPTSNLDNVEILAFISGYEYNDRPDERLADVTELFTAQSNVSYVRTLRLRLPEDVARDDYKIRLIVSDRFGEEVAQEYNILIDSQRHNLLIKDLTLIPNVASPGHALLAKVRVDNKGQRVENDVRVTVSIPSLGIQGVDYIDRVKPEGEEDTEEIFLRIPACSDEGLYAIEVTAKYADGREIVRKQYPLNMIKGDCAQKVAPSPAVPTTIHIQPPTDHIPTQDTAPKRGVLEIILFTLVGILALLGIALGVSKL